MRAAGWEGWFTHRIIGKLLVDGADAKEHDPRHHFLDASFRTTDHSEDHVEKYGRSTYGRIAPHGIVGQVQHTHDLPSRSLRDYYSAVTLPFSVGRSAMTARRSR